MSSTGIFCMFCIFLRIYILFDSVKLNDYCTVYSYTSCAYISIFASLSQLPCHKGFSASLKISPSY